MAQPTAQVSSFVASRRLAVDRTIKGLKMLPSNAAVAMRVLELKRRGDAGAAELARAVSADPALAAKVLSTANSAAFAPVTPVTRLSVAVAHLGLNNLLALVFGLSFAGIFNKLALPSDDQSALWKAALLKAVTARACVGRVCGPFGSAAEREAAGEEAFLAALLQDLALPVFAAADRSAWPEYLAVLDLPDEQRSARELSLYGIDHTAVAAGVARALALPEFYVNLAGAHHGGVSALAAAGAGPVAVAVDAAASLPHRVSSFTPRLLGALVVRLRFTAKAPADQLTELAREVAEDYTKTAALFDDPEDATASYKVFLQNLGAEVADGVEASIMGSATEISGLKERQRRLGDAVAALEDQTQRAEYDPLTRALTRAAFLARLGKLLPMARRHGAACAVGFLDLDDFKRVNDTHGHSAGDAALSAASALLASALKDTGIIGRMGGDEFVFAFVTRPEALEAAVASLAARVSRVPFAYEGTSLELTASVGVVTLGVPAADADAERVLREADRLMYQAKRGGKARGAIGRAVPDSPAAAPPSAA